MKSTIFAGKQIPDFDRQITDKLELDIVAEKFVKMGRIQIGIRNDEGDIYRRIGVTGLGKFMDCIDQLANAGLVDELQDKTSGRQGYDAIFKRVAG